MANIHIRQEPLPALPDPRLRCIELALAYHGNHPNVPGHLEQVMRTAFVFDAFWRDGRVVTNFERDYKERHGECHTLE